MKTLLCILAIALLSCAGSALAGEPASFVIACPADHLPKAANVARVFDQHNLGEVFETRQRVLDYARHACRPGVGYVRVVAAPVPARAQAEPRTLARR